MPNNPDPELFTGRCVICGRDIPLTYLGTHNPWPVADHGRACGTCNKEHVIRARLQAHWSKRMEGKQ